MHRMIHFISLSLVGTVTLVGMMPIALAAPKTTPVVQPTVPGGKRGPGCEVGGPETFLPIGPVKTTGSFSTAVVTTSEELPMIWVHVPHAVSQVKPGYFQIKHEGEYRRVSEAILTDKAGVIGIRLPSGLKMQPGKVIEWKFILECTKDASAPNPAVFGQVTFTRLPARIQTAVNQAKNPEQKAQVYAKNGYWLDAVTIVGQNRFSKPNNNATMDKEWASLLKQGKLSEIANSPIVQVVP
jgi:Domain of Unknown Function (DUF928)